jgi:hypothetical protein
MLAEIIKRKVIIHKQDDLNKINESQVFGLRFSDDVKKPIHVVHDVHEIFEEDELVGLDGQVKTVKKYPCSLLFVKDPIITTPEVNLDDFFEKCSNFYSYWDKEKLYWIKEFFGLRTMIPAIYDAERKEYREDVLKLVYELSKLFCQWVSEKQPKDLQRAFGKCCILSRQR